MDEDRTTHFNAQPIGSRRKSRPNLRWIGGLEKDRLVLRTKNWRTLARRLAWKRLLENSNAHPGLSSQEGKQCHFRVARNFLFLKPLRIQLL
ncbi:uncharacterized protein TNCV_4807131 [Trichonephila clavipes]|nr:uncharacterized protein TNCV_4807131 [Trichonephila clavipes]